MHLYETTVVVDSALRAEDLKGFSDRVASFISNNGGDVVKIEEWGKRRLAFEIKKKQYGHYLHVRFTAPAAMVALLEKEYRLNESVLRYLTIKIDPRALKKEERDSQEKAAAVAAADHPPSALADNDFPGEPLPEELNEVA